MSLPDCNTQPYSTGPGPYPRNLPSFFLKNSYSLSGVQQPHNIGSQEVIGKYLETSWDGC